MATLQPSPAAKRPRRRASGRQIPDEELTPAERRQNKLRANYAALVEAVKPCLDELAARDLAALQRTPTHFQSFPEYSECREYLRKHLEDTEAYVGLRAQYQQLLINRRAAAKMRVVHDNCTVSQTRRADPDFLYTESSIEPYARRRRGRDPRNPTSVHAGRAQFARWPRCSSRRGKGERRLLPLLAELQLTRCKGGHRIDYRLAKLREISRGLQDGLRWSDCPGLGEVFFPGPDGTNRRAVRPGAAPGTGRQDDEGASPCRTPSPGGADPPIGRSGRDGRGHPLQLAPAV